MSLKIEKLVLIKLIADLAYFTKVSCGLQKTKLNQSNNFPDDQAAVFQIEM